MAIEEIAEMKKLTEQMAALKESMREKKYDVEAREKVDELRGFITGIDEKMKDLRDERKQILDEMRPYEDILKTMGKARAPVSRVRGELKDPETGEVYASYADATRAAGIYTAGQSQHTVWTRQKGYDLEPIKTTE